MIDEIRSELRRLSAYSIRVSLDAEFEPEAGELVKIERGSAYWHLQPAEFFHLIDALPDGAGSDAVQIAIERDANQVWHGPAPLGSRDA